MTTAHDRTADLLTTEQFADDAVLAPRRCRRCISATDSAGTGC